MLTKLKHLKAIVIGCFLLQVPTLVLAQQFLSDSLIARGKAEFNKDFYEADYHKAVSSLSQAAQLAPDNPEILYFLAYATDRSVQPSGEEFLLANALNTMHTSALLERVIQLSPKYTGAKIVLDPYSKLTAVWGTLAMKFFFLKQTDSMHWAFREGVRRGAFRSFLLDNAHAILSQCKQNSILFTSGDYISFPVFYLQLEKGYRTDVTVVESGLLHSMWYPILLWNEEIVPFQMTKARIDTVLYQQWDSVEYTIPFGKSKAFVKWTVKPMQGNYLYRGNLMLLDILVANRFRRPVHLAFLPPEDLLNIMDHLYFDGLIYEIVPKIGKHSVSPALINLLQQAKDSDMKSSDEEDLMRILRWNSFVVVGNILKEGDGTAAKRLLSILDVTLPPSKVVYADWEKDFYDQVKKAIR